MPYRPHIFADNPLDRGDRERRDETWLAHKAEDSDTRFLVMPELDVPLTEGEGPSHFLDESEGRDVVRHRGRPGLSGVAGRGRPLCDTRPGFQRCGGAAEK